MCSLVVQGSFFWSTGFLSLWHKHIFLLFICGDCFILLVSLDDTHIQNGYTSFVLFHGSMFSQPVKKRKVGINIPRLSWADFVKSRSFDSAFLTCPFFLFLLPSGAPIKVIWVLHESQLICLSPRRAYSWTELKVSAVFNQSSDSLKGDFMWWEREELSLPVGRGTNHLSGSGAWACGQGAHPALSQSAGQGDQAHPGRTSSSRRTWGLQAQEEAHGEQKRQFYLTPEFSSVILFEESSFNNFFWKWLNYINKLKRKQ